MEKTTSHEHLVPKNKAEGAIRRSILVITRNEMIFMESFFIMKQWKFFVEWPFAKQNVKITVKMVKLRQNEVIRLMVKVR